MFIASKTLNGPLLSQKAGKADTMKAGVRRRRWNSNCVGYLKKEQKTQKKLAFTAWGK